MRHNKAGYKLKRNVSARRALLRNIVTSVILEERVITTVPKAKAAKPIVDQIITLAKRENKDEQLHALRQAAAYLMTPASVQKLFDQIGPRFATRNWGYTRVVRVGFRKGDGAETAVLELVGSELVRRSADRAKRREDKLKAMQEGREGGGPAAS